MEERHKIAQVKAHMRVCTDTQNPLFDKVGREVKSRLKRGTEWMNQAATTISKCCNVTDIMKGSQWVHVEDSQEQFTTVVAALGKECREWPPGAADAEVEALIEEWEIPGGAVIFTDGSVVRGVKSGWAFMARENGHTDGKVWGI